MSMSGVDISSHQSGMDCVKTKADFFIVKATQGTTYVNPFFSRHYAQAVAAWKLVGAYHYASGGDPAKEADYFLSIVGKRVGECIMALDWEHIKGGGENPAFNTSREVSWCQAFAKRIHDKTGVWPLIYMSASVTRRRDWSAVAKNCPLWLAQYGSNDLTGYQSERIHYRGAVESHGYTRQDCRGCCAFPRKDRRRARTGGVGGPPWRKGRPQEGAGTSLRCRPARG